MAGFFDGGVFSAPYASGRIVRGSFFLSNFKDISNNAFFGGLGFTFTVSSSVGVTTESLTKFALRTSSISSATSSMTFNLKVFYSFNVLSSVACETFSQMVIPFGGNAISGVSVSVSGNTKLALKSDALSGVVAESRNTYRIASYMNVYSSVAVQAKGSITYDIVQLQTIDGQLLYADYRPTTIIVPKLKKKDR